MDAIIDVFMKETKSILRSKLSDAIFCNNTLLTEAKTYAIIKFKENGSVICAPNFRQSIFSEQHGICFSDNEGSKESVKQSPHTSALRRVI